MMGINRTLSTRLACAGLLAGLLLGAGAQADTPSCREWRGEHREWKTEVLRRTLRGAPQSAIDESVFELLQREAWLTSCDVSVRVGRDELVGWRLAQRLPDEYANAVVVSVLERAGFDVGLRELFVETVPVVAKAPSRSRGRRVGSR
ncbi:MAG: hypothetical protein JRG84_17040 [Deltaproteobacteria bacterium]|nr:hypothetical protein [Deltaproteobacteria bacterium]